MDIDAVFDHPERVLLGQPGVELALVFDRSTLTGDPEVCVRAQVALRTSGVHAVATVFFFRKELVGFVERLGEVGAKGRGVASVQADGRYFSLKVAHHGGGVILVSGHLKPSPWESTAVVYEFPISPTALAGALSAFRSLVA